MGDVRLAERAYYATRHKIFHNCQSQCLSLPKPFRKNVKTSPGTSQTYVCVIHLLMIKLCWHTAKAISVRCECGWGRSGLIQLALNISKVRNLLWQADAQLSHNRREAVRIRDCVMTKHGGGFVFMFSEGVMGNSSTAACFGLQFYQWQYLSFSNMFSYASQLQEKAARHFVSHPGAHIKMWAGRTLDPKSFAAHNTHRFVWGNFPHFLLLCALNSTQTFLFLDLL